MATQTSLGLIKPEIMDDADLTIFIGQNMDLIDEKLRKTSELNQITKLGVVASQEVPHVTNIIIPETLDFKRPSVEVLKFVAGEQNKMVTIATFNNADASDFQQDDYVEFDGTMHLKTNYQENMNNDGTIGSGIMFSYVIDKTAFKRIDNLEVVI